MSLALRTVEYDARKEIGDLEVTKRVGNRFGAIRKRCFERVGDGMHESGGCESRTFEHVTNCWRGVEIHNDCTKGVGE